ncbi:MAG: lysophospholipid acyltransferase family protein [Capsulimonadaceae bacterium]
MKKFWQWIVRNTFRGLLRLLRFVPWKPALATGAALGSLGCALSKRYRGVADRNLRNAYGDTLSRRDREQLTRRVFQHFGRCLIEFLKAPSLPDEEVRRMVPVPKECFTFLDGLLARGKGLIVISAHIGNWELLARRGGVDGYRFAVVARQSPDDGLNEVTDYIRKTGGYDVLPRGKSARAILQKLHKGGIVAILPDQKSEDVFVPFFGRLAGTVAGPAVLALKVGTPIVILFCIRQPDGTYRVEMSPEVDIVPRGTLEEDTRRIMTDITSEVEAAIRRHPEQWLWMHDRWKAPVPEHLQREYEESTPEASAKGVDISPSGKESTPEASAKGEDIRPSGKESSTEASANSGEPALPSARK